MSRKTAVVLFLVFVSAVASGEMVISDWSPIYQGVCHSVGRSDSPRLEVVNALRIDMNDPAIRFITTPSNGDESLEVFGQTTVDFLKEYKLQVAVNAGFFTPWDKCCVDGEPKDIRGVAISEGVLVSPLAVQSEVGSAVLLIDAENKARILDANESTDLTGVYNAVSGIPILLSKGEIKVKDDGKAEPRTAAGISKDGRYLYFIIVDGRQSGYSKGASRYETAVWLKTYGAWDGLNLDGGGSATMVKSDGKGGAVLLNRPCGYRGEGGLRVVGNNIGVYASELPGKELKIGSEIIDSDNLE